MLTAAAVLSVAADVTDSLREQTAALLYFILFCMICNMFLVYEIYISFENLNITHMVKSGYHGRLKTPRVTL